MSVRDHGPRRCGVLIVPVWVWGAWVSTVCLAGTGGPVTAPHPNIPARSGLNLSVDNHWVQGRGYRPVRVVINALKVANYDRTIEIHLQAGSDWRSDRHGICARQTISLPAGLASAAATILLPQFLDWQRFSWKVYVDGFEAPELDAAPMRGPAASGGHEPDKPHVLVVVAKKTAVGKPTAVPVADPRQGPQNRVLFPPNVAGSANELELGWSELPDRWLEYSCLDSVYISFQTLKLLSQGGPSTLTKLKALRNWVGTGGNLYVYNVGADELPQLESLFGLKLDSSEPPGKRGWKTGHDANTSVLLEQAESAAQDAAETDAAIDTTQWGVRVVLHPQQQQPLLQRFASTFLWRDYRLGCLVAIAGNRPADFEASLPREVPAPPRQQWIFRHGISFEQGSQDFWTMLIPDVGLAPISEFRVLITMFVIAIGPVNYWLLRRVGKLHMLLITVPVAAALVTGGLFLYAVVSDGFDTRVRVRSFTEIDQRLGEAVCWSRQSYYAGMAPSEGLNMPEDVTVYPVEFPSRYYSRDNMDRQRDVHWDGKQRLSRGWLDSRTPTQYLVIGARDSDKGLTFPKTAEGMRVRNLLETPVHYLLVCNPDGEFYWGESIPKDGSATLSPITEKMARGKLKPIFRQNWPRPPGVMNDGGDVFGLSQGRYWQNYGGSFQANRMEQLMGRWMEFAPPPSPRSYLAIVERSPEVRLGKDDLIESASFHVVLGRW